MKATTSRTWTWGLIAGALLVNNGVAELPPGTRERFSAQVESARNDVIYRILPHSFDTALDRRSGGYLLAADAAGRDALQEKVVISQARMVWSFSHAHVKGYSDAQRNYLEAAELGYDFLLNHFRDEARAGYFLSTARDGTPVDRTKTLVAQSAVIHAFLEYYRASADPRAVTAAFDLYRLIQLRAHDSSNNGWLEVFNEDWSPATSPRMSANTSEIAGLKSLSGHLHWLEALIPLYRETQDAGVRQAISETIQVIRKHFIPRDVGASQLYLAPDWEPIEALSVRGLSYGHNVEAAWIMIRAEKAIGREPNWDHFYRTIDHALANGFDHENGGLFAGGFGNRPATDRDRVWWAQAEMIVALTDAIHNHARPDYERALERHMWFVSRNMRDQQTGMWFEAAGDSPLGGSRLIAHNRKSIYHELRALVRFAETFGDPAGR